MRHATTTLAATIAALFTGLALAQTPNPNHPETTDPPGRIERTEQRLSSLENGLRSLGAALTMLSAQIKNLEPAPPDDFASIDHTHTPNPDETKRIKRIEHNIGQLQYTVESLSNAIELMKSQVKSLLLEPPAKPTPENGKTDDAHTEFVPRIVTRLVRVVETPWLTLDILDHQIRRKQMSIRLYKQQFRHVNASDQFDLDALREQRHLYTISAVTEDNVSVTITHRGGHPLWTASSIRKGRWYRVTGWASKYEGVITIELSDAIQVDPPPHTNP